MGVKSLWNLLTAVGRPVMLETMEGKTMAIDSSIWIYQFQATMRAKDGRALTNAHVLGFLRRICKLLFYGMKPVFVFDGGAPALKKATLTERRKKKSGAAASHVKLAEKLLAAQMRREALNHVKGARSSKGNAPVVLDENTVYLEDIDPSMAKSSPRKDSAPSSAQVSPTKKKIYDHDPYKLPEVDLEDQVAKATRSVEPDHRLATEEELRAFIEEMRPEDFDVTSPAFRELPTEVQYEIVGDLRLKSRQTSYSRLQQMLRSAPTPLDFSKQQIKNLQQRNTLTQQLLMTTDSIGKAHISIPVRIASERNKEYVLIKNEGEGRGWILGIRDDGTKQKPIVLDHGAHDDSNEDDDEDDMEEVSIPGNTQPDPDLRAFQREMALSAIAGRQTSVKNKPPIKSPQAPLFQQGDDSDIDGTSEDEQMTLAIQRSLDDRHSRSASPPPFLFVAQDIYAFEDDMDDNRFASTSKVEYRPHSVPIITAALESTPSVSASHTSPALATPIPSIEEPSAFGTPVLLMTGAQPSQSGPQISSTTPPSLTHSPLSSSRLSQNGDTETAGDGIPKVRFDILEHADPLLASPQRSTESPVVTESMNEDDSDMEEITTFEYLTLPDSPPSQSQIKPLFVPDTIDDPVSMHAISADLEYVDAEPSPSVLTSRNTIASETFEPLSDGSRPSSPDTADKSRPSSPIENWDAAQEMDPDAEEGEFARFVSQVKGRDINDVRREIDDEIKTLDQQRKAAMRDSEDVNQQMVNQIMMMLRLFGIPYITAPMEAEAQCAELVSLGLVDGIITDDSDVFLFGGQRVFKNMFNQSKTVECFLTSDLTRELGLDRGTLVRLAYLLGSDYVDGLPGVGPVIAMELLKEFPGDGGLHKFKEWWLKVQTGKDREEDNESTFRKRFKKKFKDLYLPSEWPNPAVRDAYYHPIVDESDEPFKWGLPDLDALRGFLHEELGWPQNKVDDLIIPILKKMGKRGQASAINRQGNLNGFFDVAAGSGTFAPRRRQAYASKRLQQVVSDFRRKRKALVGPSGRVDEGLESGMGEEDTPAKKKPKGSSKGKKGREPASHWRGRGRDRPNSTRKTSEPSSGEDDEFREEADLTVEIPLSAQLRPRPKPKPIYKGAQESV
ncbi:PIN domain-like protein [Guyanagaster necrorhizus]|uniref:PIN domain-like protein n=1 Tax=Guyanagaster necrorhizus TaxID=856835 RepID=A0A9P8AYT3_9AGAR|nr:PIN domain-like protein [Guyanagaster necrorhizus MCA 3950]KAG7451252.1 PIN domain-like protein [Guyanagaster necrorhizus MCA 3950]